MHSRVLLVLLLIAALLGMAMHTAADVAHAADAVHGDCGTQSADGSPDDGDGSSGAGDGSPHCCNAACHSWVPASGASAPVLIKGSPDRVITHVALLPSAVSDGLRRPPRSNPAIMV